MSELIIKAENVSKAYGKYKALDGLNMNVKEGSIYGLLGQNGAGKTSILRIFMSLIKLSDGKVNLMGENPWNMSVKTRQNIGYSSDSMQLIAWLKVGDILNYNGSFYDTWDVQYVKQWVERLNLSVNKRVFSLSRGDRQKLSLIMAIGHRPKLLILDEPAGGLDPVARKEFLESIIELIHESGTSIVISSHQLSDLERISDHIGIIDSGKMKIETDIESLKMSTRKVTILTKNSEQTKLPIDGILKIEKSHNTIRGILKDWNDKKLHDLKQQFPDANIEVEPLSLEEIFLAYTDRRY